MALHTGLALTIATELTKSDGLASASADTPWTYGFQWPDGTGADQANRLYQGRRTLSASANEDLDLAGVLTDTYAATITFARIKAIIVKAAAGNTNNVVVGAAATNTFVGPFGAATHTVAVKPGGLFLAIAPDATGWAVTSTSADLLRFANSGAGTTVTYDVFLIGASA
jgi:hypothetical protein